MATVGGASGRSIRPVALFRRGICRRGADCFGVGGRKAGRSNRSDASVERFALLDDDDGHRCGAALEHRAPGATGAPGSRGTRAKSILPARAGRQWGKREQSGKAMRRETLKNRFLLNERIDPSAPGPALVRVRRLIFSLPRICRDPLLTAAGTRGLNEFRRAFLFLFFTFIYFRVARHARGSRTARTRPHGRQMEMMDNRADGCGLRWIDCILSIRDKAILYARLVFFFVLCLFP